MEALTKRQKAVLEVLDEELQELEEKLEKIQPLIDERDRLRRTRATLLSERSVTGNIGSRTRLTMEQVIHAFRENENEPMTPAEVAEAVGTDVTVVRSHLNRHADTRYRKNGDGNWKLIGEDTEEENEED